MSLNPVFSSRPNIQKDKADVQSSKGVRLLSQNTKEDTSRNVSPIDERKSSTPSQFPPASPHRKPDLTQSTMNSSGIRPSGVNSQQRPQPQNSSFVPPTQNQPYTPGRNTQYNMNGPSFGGTSQGDNSQRNTFQGNPPPKQNWGASSNQGISPNQNMPINFQNNGQQFMQQPLQQGMNAPPSYQNQQQFYPPPQPYFIPVKTQITYSPIRSTLPPQPLSPLNRNQISSQPRSPPPHQGNQRTRSPSNGRLSAQQQEHLDELLRLTQDETRDIFEKTLGNDKEQMKNEIEFLQNQLLAKTEEVKTYAKYIENLKALQQKDSFEQDPYARADDYGNQESFNPPSSVRAQQNYRPQDPQPPFKSSFSEAPRIGNNVSFNDPPRQYQSPSQNNHQSYEQPRVPQFQALSSRQTQNPFPQKSQVPPNRTMMNSSLTQSQIQPSSRTQAYQPQQSRIQFQPPQYQQPPQAEDYGRYDQMAQSQSLRLSQTRDNQGENPFANDNDICKRLTQNNRNDEQDDDKGDLDFEIPLVLHVRQSQNENGAAQPPPTQEEIDRLGKELTNQKIQNEQTQMHIQNLESQYNALKSQLKNREMSQTQRGRNDKPQINVTVLNNSSQKEIQSGRKGAHLSPKCEIRQGTPKQGIQNSPWSANANKNYQVTVKTQNTPQTDCQSPYQNTRQNNHQAYSKYPNEQPKNPEFGGRDNINESLERVRLLEIDNEFQRLKINALQRNLKAIENECDYMTSPKRNTFMNKY